MHLGYVFEHFKIIQIFHISVSLQDIDVTDNPLLIKYSLDAASVNAFYYIHQKLEAIEYEIITEEDFLQNFCYIRLQATLPFISEKTTVLDSLQKTRKNVNQILVLKCILISRLELLLIFSFLVGCWKSSISFSTK